MTTTVDELEKDLSPADDAVFEAPAVLRIIWADPENMAEHLAIWSLARFGPRADAAVAAIRRDHPDADRTELERLVVERQTRVAMTEGAFVGGPFIVLIPVAFCAGLLAQAQMVFELATAAGYEPNDRTRAAELLVLLGAYDSTDEAAQALAKTTMEPRREGKRLPRGTRWEMIKRMAYLLGVFTIDDGRSTLRAVLGWTGVGILFLVGLVLPLVWVPYMAYTTRRSTRRLGERARAYYTAAQTDDAGVMVRGREGVRIGGAVALVRTVIFALVPIVVGIVALLGGMSILAGRVESAVVLLIAVSALATLMWLGYRWWRHRPHEALAQEASA